MATVLWYCKELPYDLSLTKDLSKMFSCLVMFLRSVLLTVFWTCLLGTPERYLITWMLFVWKCTKLFVLAVWRDHACAMPVVWRDHLCSPCNFVCVKGRSVSVLWNDHLCPHLCLCKCMVTQGNCIQTGRCQFPIQCNSGVMLCWWVLKMKKQLSTRVIWPCACIMKLLATLRR